MASYSIGDFTPVLSAFAGKETLSPGEASLLQLKIAEFVLDHPIDLQLLKFMSRFWTPTSYDETVEERNIEHQCGYPLCQKSPKHQVRRASVLGGPLGTSTKYQIYNRKPSMILPNTFLSQYCCKDHYQASLFYRNQLSLEAVFSRKNIMLVPPFAQIEGTWYENNITCLEEVLAKHRELREQGKSLADVIVMMNGLTVADDNNDTAELVKLVEHFEIVEHSHPEPPPENDVPHDAENDYESAVGSVDNYITLAKCFGGYVV